MAVVPDTIDIELGDVRPRALLGIPDGAEGLVVFAHGSGSGRSSPRNNRVTAALRETGLATLLIVGGLDTQVVALNRMAHDRLTATKELVIVPGAGHLFEEPGTLDTVQRHAIRWFRRHLAGDQDI